jgi:hypothetical protein
MLADIQTTNWNLPFTSRIIIAATVIIQLVLLLVYSEP